MYVIRKLSNFSYVGSFLYKITFTRLDKYILKKKMKSECKIYDTTYTCDKIARMYLLLCVHTLSRYACCNRNRSLVVYSI